MGGREEIMIKTIYFSSIYIMSIWMKKSIIIRGVNQLWRIVMMVVSEGDKRGSSVDIYLLTNPR